VWGWNIARAAAAEGVAELETRQMDVDPAEALALAIRMEGRRGSYSLQEQLAIADAAARLGIGLSQTVSELVRGDGGLEEVTRRITTLPEEVAAEVVAGRIDLRVAERVAGLPGAIFGIVGLGRFSHSHRRQFLEMLEEIARRDAMSPDAVLAMARGVLERETGRPDVAVAALRTIRYPTLTSMEESVRELTADATRAGLTVTPPEHFEGDSYSVRFGFRSCDELAERLDAASTLKGCCEELFRLL
jgi:hypothetical protein